MIFYFSFNKNNSQYEKIFLLVLGSKFLLFLINSDDILGNKSFLFLLK